MKSDNQTPKIALKNNQQALLIFDGNLLLEFLPLITQQFSKQKYELTKTLTKASQNKQFLKYIEISSSQQKHNEEEKEKENKLKILKDILTSICKCIGEIPQIYIELLEEEILTSETNILDLNSKNQFIVKRILQRFTLIFQKQQIQFSFINLKLQNVMLFQRIHDLLVVIAKRISELFTKCVKIVSQQLQNVTQIAKKSKLMNSFLMFKLLREVSNNSKKNIEQLAIEGVFKNCSSKYIKIFINYVIEKFQNIFLFADKKHSLEETRQKGTNKNGLTFLTELEDSGKFKYTKRNAISPSGQFAIFLKTYQANEAQKDVVPQDYLIKIDQETQQLVLLNCKLIRKKWTVSMAKPQAQLSKLSVKVYELIKKNQETLQKNKNQIKQNEQKMMSIDNLTNTGGTIGKCLAMIKQYKGVGQFFVDLSQKAILTQSFEHLVKSLPTVGYLLAAGNFTYSFYTLVNNNASTGSRKFKQIGSMTVVAGSTIGSSILGATIGQALIPIPVFGAFVGTVVGGMLGEKGGKKLNSFFQNKKFIDIIGYLKKNIVDNHYWLYSKEFVDLLQIKQKQFQKCIPKDMKDFIFTTMICFVLVCFYESKNQQRFNKEKSGKDQLKEQQKIDKKDDDKNEKKDKKNKKDNEKQSKKQKEVDILEKQTSIDKLQEQILKMKDDELYEPQFNIIKIIIYLEENKANLGQHIQMLQKTMVPFLTKI